MSLVRFSARNHPQQAVRDAVDDRRTPHDLFDALNAEHHFTLDAAASEQNALLPKYCTRAIDGLSYSWRGERVWCNPPFSRLEPWVTKAWREIRAGCPLVVMLLPANRCEQKFWQAHIEPWRDGGGHPEGGTLTTRFLPGRPRFAAPGAVVPRKGDRPPFGIVLLTFTADTP